MVSVYARTVLMQVPLTRCHTFAVQSAEPLTRYLSSVVPLMHHTDAVWPLRIRRTWPSPRCQTRIVLSALPEHKMVAPSHTHVTALVWPFTSSCCGSWTLYTEIGRNASGFFLSTQTTGCSTSVNKRWCQLPQPFGSQHRDTYIPGVAAC